MSSAGSAPRFNFSNSYARLPERFFARVTPARVAAPELLQLNTELAKFLGLDPDELASAAGVAVLAGNQVAEGSEPLAIAYAGHQFGNFVPQLGDGRANLLGEVIAQDGRGYDLQLKGSGPTRFSRRGDGRAALGPVLREYVVSEAMAALGVPTTRALAAVLTGEQVVRETMQPGAVLTRVAASHLRVGTFQYFAAQNDLEGLRLLARYAMERHYPEAVAAEHPVRALLDGVIIRQASLVARWMTLGFIHGVMNTDNTSISGETIDYGPCAFLEAYEPDKVFSSIDQQGRYAYSNQPLAMHWNLARLAEALLPLMVEEYGGEEAALDSARAAIAQFLPQFDTARLAGFCRKLGIEQVRPGDGDLVETLLELMAETRADFTATFHGLSQPATTALQSPAYPGWHSQWQQRLQSEPGDAAAHAETMRLANPVYIPRNHLVQQVIDAALIKDYRPFEDLLAATAHPYTERPGLKLYSTPARQEEQVLHTFCGT